MTNENVGDEQEADAKRLTKAELIVHPVRLRIIEAFQGRDLTTRQIAALLPDVPQASLYRQIKRLHDAKILVVAEEKAVNGIIERTYALREGATHLSREEFAAISAEDHARYFAIFLGVMAAQMNRYLGQESYDTTAEGMTYFQAVLHLTDEEARQVRVDLLEMVERIGKLGRKAGSRPRALTVVFLPEVALERDELKEGNTT
jgi:hypothetical protein